MQCVRGGCVRTEGALASACTPAPTGSGGFLAVCEGRSHCRHLLLSSFLAGPFEMQIRADFRRFGGPGGLGFRV